jgi:hypothetical protein
MQILGLFYCGERSTGHRAQGTEHRARGKGHRAQSTERRAEGTGHRAQGRHRLVGTWLSQEW